MTNREISSSDGLSSWWLQDECFTPVSKPSLIAKVAGGISNDSGFIWLFGDLEFFMLLPSCFVS